MERGTLLFRKILGEKKYLKLLFVTLKNLTEKRKKLEIGEFLEAMHFNSSSFIIYINAKSRRY